MQLSLCRTSTQSVNCELTYLFHIHSTHLTIAHASYSAFPLSTLRFCKFTALASFQSLLSATLISRGASALPLSLLLPHSLSRQRKTESSKRFPGYNRYKRVRWSLFRSLRAASQSAPWLSRPADRSLTCEHASGIYPKGCAR